MALILGCGLLIAAASSALGADGGAAVQQSALPPYCAGAPPSEPAPPPVAGDADFPASYAESRDRFRADCAFLAATGVGGCGKIYTLQQSGEADLTVDTAFASRAGNPHLLVLQSGLHGVEAFAGAAVQHLVMRALLSTLLDRGFDVLLVHAINPYGFKHLRRVDACNVDLNRNFSRDGSIYHRANPAYDELKDLMENPAPVASVFWDSLTYRARLLLRWRGGFAWLGGMDFDALAAGTHSGQYVVPAGLEFGGQHHAEQAAILDDLLTNRIKARAGRTYFLDLHTGLGPPNHLTVYSGRAWWDKAHPDNGPLRFDKLDDFVQSLKAREITAVSAYGDVFPTFGDVIDYVPELGPDGAVIALTLEWGTLGNSPLAELETNVRMQLEHEAHFHDCTSSQTCLQVRRDFVDLFNPQTDPLEQAAFRKAVLAQFSTFIDALTRTAPFFTSGS